MLWVIQLNRRQKISLMCILGLGVFATSAACVKLTFLPNYGRSGDLMWDSRNLTIWTVTECNVGIVAANLSCLKPLFNRILVSTYGQGSRKPSHPRYSSKPYGLGSKHRSVIREYDSLDSDKVAERGLGDAYMLTTIDAHKIGAVSKITSGRSSPSLSKESEDSELGLHRGRGRGFNGMRDIKVTTKVDVTESVHSREMIDEGRRYEQPQAKEMV
jgi:hypothetical protein